MWRILLTCGLGLLCLAGFRHAYRPPALPGSTMTNTRLVAAHLPGADFRKANLCGSDLASADLSGARLSGADLSLTNMCMTNLARADLRETNLRGANLMYANLRSAVLEGAVYDQHTTWPDGIAPETRGARYEESPRLRPAMRPFGARVLGRF